MTLKKYFKENDTNIYTQYLVSNTYNIYIKLEKVYIDNEYIDSLYVGLEDCIGHSINIGDYIPIKLDTKIDEIESMYLEYIVANYLYSHC